MSDFNQNKYINDFIKEKYDTFKVQVPKGQKIIIEKHWKKNGFKSMNSYINHLIAADMQQNGADQTVNVQTNNGIIMRDNQGTINM